MNLFKKLFGKSDRSTFNNNEENLDHIANSSDIDHPIPIQNDHLIPEQNDHLHF